jgi:hypothetical protein
VARARLDGVVTGSSSEAMATSKSY